MGSKTGFSLASRAEPWIALALCAAVLAARALEQLTRGRPADAQTLAPDWLPLAATLFAATGIIHRDSSPGWLRAQRALRWGGLLLMVWTANGLPFDLLRIVGLIPLGVDWPGLVTRTLALGAALALARLALEAPAAGESTHAATWYGYAAFVLALPYPVLRTHWAFGGTLGLGWPGAAGEGFAPFLIAFPFLLAAALSLLLVSPPLWMPRRLLLAAGWFATAVVGMIGPAACWSLVNTLVVGGNPGFEGMAIWVPALFYSSWLLWAIAAGAATRSYQLRSAAPRSPSDTGGLRVPGSA